MRVYTSIFPKISILSLDVEITYLGVFRSQKVVSGHKNRYGDELGVYRFIFIIMSTIALGLKNAYCGVSKYWELSSDHEKFLGPAIEGPHFNFHKDVNFIP